MAYFLFVYFSAVMNRPVEATSDMPLKIRILQFLARINDGEKLGKNHKDIYKTYLLQFSKCQQIACFCSCYFYAIRQSTIL